MISFRSHLGDWWNLVISTSFVNYWFRNDLPEKEFLLQLAYRTQFLTMLTHLSSGRYFFLYNLSIPTQDKCLECYNMCTNDTEQMIYPIFNEKIGKRIF